jgi:hypothetical protein
MNEFVHTVLPVAGPWAVFATLCLWLMRPDPRRSKAAPDGRTALREEIEALAAIHGDLVTRLSEHNNPQSPPPAKAASTSASRR